MDGKPLLRVGSPAMGVWMTAWLPKIPVRRLNSALFTHWPDPLRSVPAERTPAGRRVHGRRLLVVHGGLGRAIAMATEASPDGRLERVSGGWVAWSATHPRA